MPTWAAFLAGATLAVTVVTLLIKSGVWMGHQEVASAEIDRLRNALRSDIARLDSEIVKLRDWRHKVGDDPCSPLLTLYHLIEQDIAELRTAVFKSHWKP